MKRCEEQGGENDWRRAVSPVVGVVLMVALTLLLATTFTVVFSYDMQEGLADDVVAGDVETGNDGDVETEDGSSIQDDLVVAEDAAAGAAGIVHSTVVEVDGAAGEELQELTIDYPKDEVYVDTTSHDEVVTIGVDTDGDGELDESFDADDVSGVNTNDGNSILTVTLDTGYTLEAGDRVKIRYDQVDNPDAAGEYDVTVTVNGGQTESGTLVIEAE